MHENWRYAAAKLREASGTLIGTRGIKHAVKLAAERPGPVYEADVPDSTLWQEFERLRKRLRELSESDDYSVNDLTSLAYDLDALADKIEQTFQ